MTSIGTGIAVVEPGRAVVRQAHDDAHLVALWVGSSNSAHTRRARSEDAARFLAAVGKPLAVVTVGDLQDYAAALTGSDSARARKVNHAKSLLSFGQRLGYLAFNVANGFEGKPGNAIPGWKALGLPWTH